MDENRKLTKVYYVNSTGRRYKNAYTSPLFAQASTFNQIQQALDSPARWSSDSGLSFSSAKCRITSRSCCLPTDGYILYGNPITHFTEIKDLGLRYSSTFGFSHQVQFQVVRTPQSNKTQTEVGVSPLLERIIRQYVCVVHPTMCSTAHQKLMYNIAYRTPADLVTNHYATKYTPTPIVFHLVNCCHHPNCANNFGYTGFGCSVWQLSTPPYLCFTPDGIPIRTKKYLRTYIGFDLHQRIAHPTRFTADKLLPNSQNSTPNSYKVTPGVATDARILERFPTGGYFGAQVWSTDLCIRICQEQVNKFASCDRTIGNQTIHSTHAGYRVARNARPVQLQAYYRSVVEMITFEIWVQTNKEYV
ncbi:hypothetical protein CLF_101937 [Clonorchis sinensis]|uniref:Uncharacterized protein n=1 Tax=Clonorchis sinensis TaxID=79923 RepID=G7Y6X1_CLOSI|nr:hypothetical protein CLF_101937 [Clonorchis sinensis]